jgi:hypothetical protein
LSHPGHEIEKRNKLKVFGSKEARLTKGHKYNITKHNLSRLPINEGGEVLINYRMKEL